MRFGYTPPENWRPAPYPPPQNGVCLRWPEGTPRAVILLMDRVVPHGTLPEQLQFIVGNGSQDGELIEKSQPEPLHHAKYPALRMTAKIRVLRNESTHIETRVFALLDVGPDRLPIVFLGSDEAFAVHGAVFAALIASVTPEEEKGMFPGYVP